MADGNARSAATASWQAWEVQFSKPSDCPAGQLLDTAHLLAAKSS